MTRATCADRIGSVSVGVGRVIKPQKQGEGHLSRRRAARVSGAALATIN
jgi:hypothetical protein